MLNAGRWVFFCYGLMLLHELAHVFCAFLFKCHVPFITIYPFGLCAEVEGTDFLAFSQRLLLYSAGACVHLVVFAVIEGMYRMDAVSLIMKDYLFQLNMNYLLFNLLPVYPLDGYQIFISFLYVLFPYRKALWISQGISFCVLIWLIGSSGSLVVVLSCILLMLMNGMRCVQFEKLTNIFYLKRYLSELNYPLKCHCFDDLYVYKTNVKMERNGCLSEKMMLKKILKL